MASPVLRHLKKVARTNIKTPPVSSVYRCIGSPSSEDSQRNRLRHHGTRDANCSSRRRLVESSKKCLDHLTTVNPVRNEQLAVGHVQLAPLPSINTPDRMDVLLHGLNARQGWSILGRGSFGTVVRAEYRKNRVAVKVIEKSSPEASISLIKELHSVDLRHPNIVQIFKVVTQVNALYGLVLMEECSQTNLQHLIDDPTFSFKLKDKIRYCHDLSLGLEYCHSQQVVHLDVKPKNILMNRTNNNCKLCDFGSSARVGEASLYQYGTLKYTAPELLQGLPVTEKADVYSLGITMWQVLFQETPYLGDCIDVVIYKVVSQNYRPKSESESNDAEFIALYESCWEMNPERRPSMAKVVVNLQHIAQYNTGKNNNL